MIHPPSRPLVVAVGHFPPPLHGMAVATDRLVSMIAERTEVKVLVTSAGPGHGLKRHLVRLARTLGAIYRMRAARRQSEVLYVGSDAGLGMSYTLAVVSAGRLIGYRIFLHHHSAAYVRTWSLLMAAIVRAGGGSCTHVLSCGDQANAFATRYRPVLPPMVLPISYALAAGPSPKVQEQRAERERCKPQLVLGHLSNLSVQKGLERVFQTLHAALAAGLDVRLVVAGPPATEHDEAVLVGLLADAQPHAVYLGPADEPAKRRFFEAIDVFLFPSRYRHESFGLVTAEAMQAGIPIIAYRAGCLNAGFVDEGGLVLEPDQDFASSALQQLRQWFAHPEEWERSGSNAFVRAHQAREDGLAKALAFVELLMVPVPPS